MNTVIEIDELLQSRALPILDVRSPSEFNRGHIPGAFSTPLLDDDQRAEVGTLYKNAGRQLATTRGLELVAAKGNRLVDSVKSIESGPDLAVHCWRGGMRSQGFAWLLEQCGFTPRLLRGGYKAFRQAAHRCFAETRRVVILGGHSGAGKTHLLNLLRDEGEQVIDLEALAGHRGSVFGGIGRPPQPTVEQFENQLFLHWRDLDPDRVVWIESESRAIGTVFLPQPVWDQMSDAPAILVEVDRKQRVEFLVQEYGELPADQLAAAMQRISKRLGGASLQAALRALECHDLHKFADIALDYYDRAYSNAFQQRPRDHLITIPLSSPGHPESLTRLREKGLDLVSASAR